MPSPRRTGRRRLLHPWELEQGEGDPSSVPGARPCAVAPSSWQTLSPARIPDWEREEGNLALICGARPCAVALSSRQTLSPARIPDWEREEGEGDPSSIPGARPRAVAPSSWQTSSPALVVPFLHVRSHRIMPRWHALFTSRYLNGPSAHGGEEISMNGYPHDQPTDRTSSLSISSQVVSSCEACT